MAKVPYKGSPSVDASMTPLPPQNMPHVDLSGPGQELNQLGKAFQGLGDTLAANQIKMQDRQNDAVINDLVVQGTTEIGTQGANYVNTQGQQAIDGYQPHVEQVEATRARLQAQADAYNPEVGRRFRMQMDPHVGSAVVRAAGHNAQQMKVYENNAAIARERNAVDDTMANYKDDHAFERNLETVRGTVDARAKTLGWSDEQKQAEMRAATDKVYDARIRGYARQEPTTARAILDRNRDKIGGETQIKLDLHLNEQDANIRSRIDADHAIKTGEFPDEEPVVTAPDAPGPRSEADPAQPLTPAAAVKNAEEKVEDVKTPSVEEQLQPGAKPDEKPVDALPDPRERTEIDDNDRVHYAQANTGTKSDAPVKVSNIGPLQDQGPRPPKYSGEITLGSDAKFSFVSGGGQTPSAPYGTYPITPGKEGPIITRLGGVAINNNAMYDPLLKRNREGIAFHPASGAQASAGCLIIPDGQWGKFKAALQTKIATEGPQYLTINPDGSAFVSNKPGRLANDPIGPQSGTSPSFRAPSGLNQKRINEVAQGPNGSIIANEAMKAGYDPNKIMTLVSIESGGNARQRTGSYHGLGQLSKAEFAKYGPPGGDIYNPRDNIQATIAKLQAEEGRFQKQFNREPSALEMYMGHQQGEAGARAHFANPEGIAWKNVRKYYSDAAAVKRGFVDGDDYAKHAIWDNLTKDEKARFGSVENVKSAALVNVFNSKISGGAYADTRTAVADSGWDPSQGDSADRTGLIPASLANIGFDTPQLGRDKGSPTFDTAEVYAQAQTGTATDAVSPGPLREDSGPDWLEQMLKRADLHSDKVAPGNIKYKENLMRSIKEKYDLSVHTQKTKQRGYYNGIMTAVMGDFQDNMIRSMDDIRANETLNEGFNKLSPQQKKVVEHQVGLNSKQDLIETPERFSRYRELKGMAVTEPEKFLDAEITGLPRNRMNELLNMQINQKKHMQQNSITQEVLRNTGKLAAEAGVVAQYNDPGRMKIYNEFAGAMHVKVQEFVEQNKKKPNLDEQQRMAAEALAQKTPFDIMSPSTWFGGEMKFELPSKWTYQGKERSQDELRDIFRKAYNTEPTPADMYRFWQRSIGAENAGK